MVRRRGGPKVAFNRLRAPGEGDVRDRIEAVYAAVDGMNAEDLNRVPVPVFAEGRADRMADLEVRAAEAGRVELLDTARDRLKDALLKRWTGTLALAWGMESVQTGRVEDRAAIVTALRDLVAVAVVLDRLPPEDATVLAEPGLRIVGARDFAELDAMTAVGDGDEGEGDDEDADLLDEADVDRADGAVDELGLATGAVRGEGAAPDARAVPERLLRADDARPGAPSADDWAEADRATADGPGGFRPDAVSIGFGALAIVGLFSVLAMRVERASVLSGLILVGALLLLVFVAFRLWSRRRTP